MVVIEAVKEVNKYVHLSDIKSNKNLSELTVLIKQARLSVVPVSAKHIGKKYV